VSCSPFRVPIARLAAAHAAIKSKKEGKKTEGKKEIVKGKVKDFKKAKSISDEIRDIVRKEIAAIKNEFGKGKKK
jgi:hypothetical protein